VAAAHTCSLSVRARSRCAPFLPAQVDFVRPKETAVRYEGEDAEAVTGEILAVVFKAQNCACVMPLAPFAPPLTRACHHATR
jgi:hypothetical protein